MRKAFLYLIPAVILAGACTRALEPAEAESPDTKVQEATESAIIPGEVFVKMDEENADLFASGFPATKSDGLCTSLESMGVVRVERVFPDAGEWEPRHREAGLHRWFRLTYDPAAQAVTKGAADFAALPGIVSAEPVRRVKLQSYFNDPGFSKQWPLYNDGSKGSAYKAGADINVVPVWERFTAGSNEVIVAVIDEGVQMDHPDLAAVMIPGGKDGSRSFMPGYEGYNIPVGDHGTHVAGVIAAINDNETGICGIAGGRNGQGGVRILACPFLRKDPETGKTISGDAGAAFVWAADHGAVIAQNSWGTVYETESDAANGGVGMTGDAIDYFIKYAGCDANGNQRADSPMKGGVVIFAAGNEGWQYAWPAMYEPVIAVGALSSKGSRAYYSNYGDWVDICAPGGDVRVGPEVYSTVSGGSYDMMQGTSMACPHVSGVAALLVSYFGGPGFTNEMLKERLLGGASDAKAPKYGLVGPALDALGAFTLGGSSAPEAVGEISASVLSNSITLSWDVTADPDDNKSYGYLVLSSTKEEDLQDVNPRSVPETVQQHSVQVGTIELGAPISTTLSDLAFETQYYIAIFAYDYAGNYSGRSAIKAVSTGANTAPAITTEYTGELRVKSFETLSFEYVVSDPDGHAFTVETTPGSDALSMSVASSDASAKVSCRLAGNAAPAGKYTAHIVATDSYGAATDLAIEYEVLENHAPVVIAEIADTQLTQVGESVTFDMSQYVRDEDGETLKYTVASTVANVAHLNPSGNSLVLTTLGFGSTTFTVTATDACNASCSFSFQVLVRDASRPVDLYPNPVVNTLYVRPGAEGQISVSISNKAGATVWSGDATASPFSPLAVDMSDLAGGIYYVHVQGAGVDDVYPVAKK